MHSLSWLVAGAVLVAGCGATSADTSGSDAGSDVQTSVASGCPMTPGAACGPDTIFSTTTCSCEKIPCNADAVCDKAGGQGLPLVCDFGVHTCAVNPACRATQLCGNTTKPGGSCDCHEDCQCDPGNKSGAGATFCFGGSGTCMPRCNEQADPALFCRCVQAGTTCAPSGACEHPCKGQSDCNNVYQATCTSGFCVPRVDTTINTGGCADAGAGDGG